LYLALYSPELNPIEQAFAKIKALLRRKAGAARTREALIAHRSDGLGA
jgi:transposase